MAGPEPTSFVLTQQVTQFAIFRLPGREKLQRIFNGEQQLVCA